MEIITRIDACNELTSEFGLAMLPEICLELRMAVNGAADPWPKEKIKKTIALLQLRLNTWIPSYSKTKRVDNAVKELILATIEEVNEKI